MIQKTQEDVKKPTNAMAFEVNDKEVEENEWDGSIDSSVIHGAINVSKNGLGAVSLFIAAGFYEGGLVFGGLILIVSCILSATSFFIIAKCCHLTNSSSYTEIFKRAFGERFGWVCSMIIGLFTTNILVLYVLVLGVFSLSAFEQWHLLDWIPDDMNSEGEPVKTWKNIFLITVISVAIAIPLSFLKELKYFKYTSSFGLLSLIFASFLHFSICILGENDTPAEGAINYGPRGPWNSCIFFAVFIGGFNCHFNAANYYKSTGCNIKKFRLIVMISFSFMLAVNLMMGYSAFFNRPSAFVDHSDPPSIMLFNDDPRSLIQIAGLIGCLGIALNIAFGFGLVGFATRLSLNEFIQFLGTKFDICSRFTAGTSKSKSSKKINDDPSIEDDNSGDVTLLASDQRSNANQTDDRHVPLTCAVIFIVVIISALFIIASRGNPGVSIGACSLALNIAVAVFGTNVALTLPGCIYYKILQSKKDHQITIEDWVIICSLIGVGYFASAAGVFKIFISNFHLIEIN